MSEIEEMPDGYLVVLSGSDADAGDSREHAGVGFVVAPWARGSLLGHSRGSSRFASIRSKAAGGQVCLVTAYAPHGGHEWGVRQRFFTDLGEFWERQRVHGPRIITGDLNARLHRRLPGEESCMGDALFGNVHAELSPYTNRELLV